MTARDTARILRPGYRGATSEPPFRLARVSSVSLDFLGNPPMLNLVDGDDERPVRITGSARDYHPGDIVAYLPRGGGGIALSKVLCYGVGDPIGDPDNAEPAEAWHEIGAVGEPGFQNGWVNVAGSDDTAAFYKQPDYWVRLKGVVSSGTDNTTIFTLPSGYRPPRRCYYTVLSNGTFAGFEIGIDGTVRKTIAGSNAYVALDGITFPTRVNETAWLRPADQNNWASSLTNGDADIGFFVRDDGWVWMRGLLAGGTVASLAMITPEPVRTWSADLHGALGLGASRHDHGGNTTAGRGCGRWVHRTGSNGDLYVGGLNWMSTSAVKDQTVLTYQNGWTGLGAEWRPGVHHRDHFGVVHLGGVVTGAAKTSNIIATLPVGMRPAKRHRFPVMFNGDVAGRVDVHANGQIEAVSGPTGYVSLSSITFRAMQ